MTFLRVLVLVLSTTIPAAADEPRPAEAAAALEWVRPSPDRTHFVGDRTGERVVLWGFNYDHDDAGRLH